MRARYTPVDGPPLITMPRDVDETVAGVARAPGRTPGGGQRRCSSHAARIAAQMAVASPLSNACTL